MLARLDRIYTSRICRNKIRNTRIIPFAHSDHDLVQISLNITKVQTQRNPWRLDNSLLKDQNYLQLITNLWHDWLPTQAHFPNGLLAWWDAFKRQVKRTTQTYQQTLKRQREQYSRSVNKRLRNLSSKPFPTNNTLNTVTMLTERKRQLEEQEARDDFLRKHTQWVEDGEKCTSYFFNQTKRRYQDTTFHSLRNDNGNIVNSTADILQEATSYFSNLYTPTHVNLQLQEKLLRNIKRRINPSQAHECDRPFTAQDFDQAVKSLNGGKSPGPDGLTTEFYQTFRDVFRPTFLKLLDEIENNHSLTASQRSAHIICIPKKGDLNDLDNWRPISLTNTDYKIIAKLLALRIQKVLPDVVNIDQTCSVPGRKIQHNLTIIRDVIHYANRTNQPHLLISLDQRKAFDTVNWNLLHKLLDKLNFGPRFRKWITILYDDIYSSVRINGFISTPFPILQGLRQGCPLSPLLFAIYAQLLGELILNNRNIRGITIGDYTHTLSQYADDTSVFLTGLSSLENLYLTLVEYYQATGQRVNPDKTQGLWLGSNRFRKDKPYNFHWSSHHVKILGLHLGTQLSINRNFQEMTTKMTKTLHRWSTRDLSLRGRVTVVNQLVASKMIYTAQIFPIPQTTLRIMQTILLTFIFNGKKQRIPSNILYLPIAEGGLNLVHLERKARAIRLASLQSLTLFTSIDIQF